MASYFEPGGLSAADIARLTNADIAASDVRGGTTNVPITLPNLVAANFANLVSGAGSAYGAWVQIAAANALALHMLIGFAFNMNSPGNMAVVDIGVGGAGAEVVIGSWPQINLTTAGLSIYYPVIPHLQIPANARVAARFVCNAAGQAAQISGVFIPRPIA